VLNYRGDLLQNNITMLRDVAADGTKTMVPG